MSSFNLKGSLLATTVIAGMAIGTPAYAQTADPGATQTTPTQPAEANEASTQPATQAPAPGAPVAGSQADTESDNTIVVTGTILRATTRATPSPVQVVDFDESEKRGINTVNDAIQSISANGAGSMSNAWSASGNFANGAAAASLRGLLTSNTLVLFDGLRGAYYPLADDGTRNFVDLNTIPDAIVDRVEILKDGASSTYGADAIAGVINIITKRQITGLHLNAEVGVSKYGDGAQRKADVTYGIGDLDKDGFNIYANASYYKEGGIRNKDRPYPYNTGNLCDAGGQFHGGYDTGNFFAECGFNVNAQPVFFVRPSGPNNTVGASAASQFQFLNPTVGCGNIGTYNVTADDQAALGPAAGAYPNQLCREDFISRYSQISLPIRRLGASIRGTVNLSDSIEAYATANWIQTEMWAKGTPGALRNNTPPLVGPVFTMSTLALPVYICPDGVDCANDPQRVLNPQNPFAAQGSQARITGLFSGVREEDYSRTRGLRGAIGVSGEVGNGFRFAVDGTAMRVKNLWRRDGYAYVANLLQAINTGALNFTNPDQNSQEVLDFVFPRLDNVTKSNLMQLQGSVAKDLFQLPGGPLQVGIGASIRREEINAPSANPERDVNGNPLSTDLENIPLIDPTQRYNSRVNPFGVIGKRTVKSAYAELQAPILNTLEVNLSGRYDKYSTGQSAFSPKAGVKFTPVREIAFRGTWSKGFRIGSFAESFGLPTTGYTPGGATVPASYAALFPDTASGGQNPYLANYTIGLTQIGNPDLKPEKSRNITLGFVAEPVRGYSFSVDLWKIKKKDVITGADTGPAIEAYYAGQPIPDGFEVIVDNDALNPVPGTPNRIQFIRYPYINAASQVASGVDFGANARIGLGRGLTLTSALEASYLHKLNTCFNGGSCQRFAGSLGPYVITSASGSPRWRGTWQNTLEFGKAYASLTAFYTSGYSLVAEDNFGVLGDCSTSSGAHFNDGTVQCRTKQTLYFNLAGGFDVNERLNIYANVNNLFNSKPPLDTGTYGGYLYNPAWSYPMMVGRYFRVGAKVNF